MNNLQKVLNKSEEKAYRELQEIAAAYGYDVHIKMRLADILPIERSGLTKELYSFALQSHFDFLVADAAHDPLFAVEFDGPMHEKPKQAARDKKKNELCVRFDLPLLRIGTKHLFRNYNKASLLRWIISAWELQKSFDDAQEKGFIPYEEPFDPVMLWHSGSTAEEIHPHWLSLTPQRLIRQLHKEGRLPNEHSCCCTFIDKDENYRGIAWIDIGLGKVVWVRSAMRPQSFPLYLGDLFDELMTVLLYNELMAFLDGRRAPCSPQSVEKRLEKMKQSYRFAGGRFGPTCVNFSSSWNREAKAWG